MGIDSILKYGEEVERNDIWQVFLFDTPVFSPTSTKASIEQPSGRVLVERIDKAH
jgi:hypothetical protein